MFQVLIHLAEISAELGLSFSYTENRLALLDSWVRGGERPSEHDLNTQECFAQPLAMLVSFW